MKKLTDLMFIEDDKSIREVTTVILSKLGKLNVTSCASGKEALEVIKNAIPQLILLDVMMPEMDGPTTLEKLREIPEIKPIPVVFMTARVQPKQVEEYLKLGVIGVISKPYDPMTLIGSIVDLWEEYQSTQSDETQNELEALYEEYGSKLGDQISEIQKFVDSLSYESSSRKDFDIVYHKVHTLCGSAGLFGYKDLGEKLKELEVILSAQNDKLSSEAFNKMKQLVKILNETLAKPVTVPSVFLPRKGN